MLSFFFSSRRRHTRWTGDWSSDVCSSDLVALDLAHQRVGQRHVVQRAGLFLAVLVGPLEELEADLAVRGILRLLVHDHPRRSEERRVGKERRSRWWPNHIKTNDQHDAKRT